MIKLPTIYEHGIEGMHDHIDETIINSPELREAVNHGNILATELRHHNEQTFLKWLELGADFHTLHRAAMERAGTSDPHGPEYRKAITKLLAQTQFGDLLDKQGRYKLLFLFEHQEAVLLWWHHEILPKQRLKWNHPTTVYKEFIKKDRPAKKPKTEKAAKADLDDSSAEELDTAINPARITITKDAAANVKAIVRAVDSLALTPKERNKLLKDMVVGLRAAI
jgi:hypothetical protein